jgi:ferredoxin
MTTADANVTPDHESELPPPVHIKTHPGLCQGWGECHRWAPDIYPLGEDGKIAVHLMDIPGEHAEDAWWGATACPEHAITLIGPPEEYWYDRLRHRHNHNTQKP